MKTKRMILLAACAIALGLTHAQAQSPFSFGVKAGVNFSTISRPNLIIHLSTAPVTA